MSIPVKPLGYNVLVEIVPVQIKSSSGIILNSENEQKREHSGRDLAKVIAFGPLAYQGVGGTKCKTPAEWGVAVGDIVELSARYDGKFTRAKEYNDKYKNYRYVNDQDILGLAQGEFLESLQSEMK